MKSLPLPGVFLCKLCKLCSRLEAGSCSRWDMPVQCMNTTQTAITIRSRLKRCHACRSKVKYTVCPEAQAQAQVETSRTNLRFKSASPAPPFPLFLYNTCASPLLFHACMHACCVRSWLGWVSKDACAWGFRSDQARTRTFCDLD